MIIKKVVFTFSITLVCSYICTMDIGEETFKLIAQEAQKARVKKSKSLSNLLKKHNKNNKQLYRTKSAPALSEKETYKNLIKAIKDNKPDVAKQYINSEIINKSDINQRTPLMWATIFNNGTLVKLLLDNNADPHRTNHNGNSPLHIALLKEIVNVGIVQLLLDAGARVFLANNTGITPDELIRKKIKTNPALKQLHFQS